MAKTSGEKLPAQSMKAGLGLAAVSRLARSLKRGHLDLKEAAFKRDCMRGLDKLELKERVQHLIRQLHRHLPSDFLAARDCVLVASENWDQGDPSDPLRGFAAWPLIDWVGEAGLKHPREALEALRKMTGLFTAEFAIRPFLEHHQKLSLRTLKRWTLDKDPKVRRLVSEGTRPRLPWGPQLGAFVHDPSPCLPLLEALKDDASESVRRSVANHLNDISKDNPKCALRLGNSWRKRASPERKWVLSHGLRTLVKKGDPDALSILGFTTQPQVKARLSLSHKELHLGERLSLQLSLRSLAQSKQHLVIDYAVVYQKLAGKTTRKVFKWKTLELAAGAAIDLEKSQVFKDFSTRKHHKGVHQVQLVVSGLQVATKSFELFL